MKPSHLAINGEVSERRFLNNAFLACRKCRPKGRGFIPSDIFMHNNNTKNESRKNQGREKEK